jgi:hypothetical protein
LVERVSKAACAVMKGILAPANITGTGFWMPLQTVLKNLQKLSTSETFRTHSSGY